MSIQTNYPLTYKFLVKNAKNRWQDIFKNLAIYKDNKMAICDRFAILSNVDISELNTTPENLISVNDSIDSPSDYPKLSSIYPSKWENELKINLDGVLIKLLKKLKELAEANNSINASINIKTVKNSEGDFLIIKIIEYYNKNLFLDVDFRLRIETISLKDSEDVNFNINARYFLNFLIDSKKLGCNTVTLKHNQNKQPILLQNNEYNLFSAPLK